MAHHLLPAALKSCVYVPFRHTRLCSELTDVNDACDVIHESDLLSMPGHLIRRAQQVHTTIWAEVVGTELTSVQFAILFALETTPGLDQRSLGERIAVDPSTLAEICRRLD